jgi:DNA repair exonuclease SbcCD ATPase subunit
MSDTNAFVNAYIDNSIGMIHENISNILQLKSQLKIANDTIAQKDALIGNLYDEIGQLKNINSQMASLREELEECADANHALKNKASHMDALTNQFSQMKAMIQERDARIEKLNSEIEIMKNPESALNNKSKKTTKVSQESSSSTKAETDDF